MSVDDVDPASEPDRTAGLLDGDELETAREEIVAFVRETVERAGAEGVVVGLSGGVDSTLAAFLAVEALGPDRVLGLNVRSNKRERLSANEARTIAEALGIEFETVMARPVIDRFRESVPESVARDAIDATPESARADATPVAEAVQTATATATAETPERVASGNALARLRMLYCYYAANARSLLVLGTANRTELLTGYFTKYGDGGADLFPLGDCYKTEVRSLARRVGVPRRIVAKPATADFWAGQTDADDLGARYEVVDALFHRVLDRGTTVAAAIEDLPLDDRDAVRLLARCSDTAHKRRRPPIANVRGRRARATDRRSGDESVPDRPSPRPSREPRSGPSRSTHAAGPPTPDTGRRAPAVDAGTVDGNRDAIFAALADERRRAVLEICYECDGPIQHDDLVRGVVDRTVDGPPETVSPGSYEGCSAALWHVHLPALTEAELIECDGRQRAIRITPLGEAIRPSLEPLLA